MISGKRRTIGVFVCKAYSLFDSAVYQTLEEQAQKLNYDVVIFTTVGYFASQNDYDAQERRMFAFAPLEELDGIIMAPDTYEIEGFRDRLLEEIRSRASCPVVAIRHQSAEFDCAYTDEKNTIRTLIRHLLEDHGLKRVCFMAGYAGHPDSENRLNIYREEMAAHGLSVDEGKDIFHGNMWFNCGEPAFDFFFANREADPSDRPEAVICANDYMAVGLMRVLTAKGYRIPEDVIVTGFDNVPDLTLECPTLTTVEQDFRGMAAAAIKELDRQIRGVSEKKDGENVRIPIPGILVKGQSCGCGKETQDRFMEISRRKASENERISTREVGMTYFTIELNACDSLKELHNALVKKRPDTPQLLDFYVCLFEQGKTRGGDPIFSGKMTDTACLVHAMKDKQDNGMPMISFDRRHLLPPMAEKDVPQVFFVTLLHQKEFSYGYAMFHYTPGELPTIFFQHWTVTLSGAIRNLHNQNELRQLYEERRKSSITDVMTKLYNRRGMEEAITPQWNRLCEEGAEVALLSFDLDYLKTINDWYGHQAGDFAIRLLAGAIQDCIPENAIAARMGGDEFLVFIPNINREKTDRILERFGQAMKERNEREQRSFSVWASCGAVVIRLEEGMTFEDCMHRSDQMMYKIKEERHAQRK